MARGLALLSVLILMTLLALIGAAAMYLTRSQIEFWEGEIRREQAYYCTEAGLQHAHARLRTGVNPGGTTFNCVVDGRTYAVGFTTTAVAGGTQLSASITY